MTGFGADAEDSAVSPLVGRREAVEDRGFIMMGGYEAHGLPLGDLGGGTSSLPPREVGRGVREEAAAMAPNVAAAATP